MDMPKGIIVGVQISYWNKFVKCFKVRRINPKSLDKEMHSKTSITANSLQLNSEISSMNMFSVLNLKISFLKNKIMV